VFMALDVGLGYPEDDRVLNSWAAALRFEPAAQIRNFDLPD
jgi:hypothetical protein